MRKSKKMKIYGIIAVIALIVVGIYFMSDTLFSTFPHIICNWHCPTTGGSAWTEENLEGQICDTEKGTLWQNTGDCKCCAVQGEACTYEMGPCQTTTTTIPVTTTTTISCTPKPMTAVECPYPDSVAMVYCPDCSLIKGINSVVWKSNTENLPSAIEKIKDSIENIWFWDECEWFVYVPNEGGTLTKLENGYCYGFRILEDTEWSKGEEDYALLIIGSLILFGTVGGILYFKRR